MKILGCSFSINKGVFELAMCVLSEDNEKREVESIVKRKNIKTVDEVAEIISCEFNNSHCKYLIMENAGFGRVIEDLLKKDYDIEIKPFVSTESNYSKLVKGLIDNCLLDDLNLDLFYFNKNGLLGLQKLCYKNLNYLSIKSLGMCNLFLDDMKDLSVTKNCFIQELNKAIEKVDELKSELNRIEQLQYVRLTI